MERDKDRYYGNYQERCRITHESQGQRCCLCFKKSQEIHHASYGNDVPGVTIFALCLDCHKIAHTGKNWIWNRDKMKSRNSASFRNKLRKGYLKCQMVILPNIGNMCYNGRIH